MKLPGPLGALDLGEPVLGHLRTAGQIPFVSAKGDEKRTSIWFVLCATRCWLVAATAEDQWSVGDTDVDLEKGWTWDALRVGEWSTPLRSGTRSQARALLKRWRLQPRNGTSVPAPDAGHAPTRARIAAGALGVPDWIADRVPADPGARWLFAFETSHEVGCASRTGQVEEHPIWFAVSDQEVVLAAEGPVEPFVQRVDPPFGLRSRTAARDLLLAGEWELPGALVDRRTPLAHTLANAPPEARWEVAVRQALDLGEADRAIDLLREAFVLERHAPAWTWVGLLALDRDPAAATAAAIHHLARHPALALEAAAASWAHRREKARKATRDLPAGLLAECALPELPPGLPWPPEGTLEVFAIAAMLSSRAADGLALWGTAGDTPRVRQAIAAWAEASEDTDAASAWLDAAQQWRDSDPVAARTALDRAIALSEAPDPLRWTAGAWAHADGADPKPYWEAALPAVPEGVDQSIDAWRLLADFAESEGAHEAELTALRRVRDLDPAERDALVREAALCEGALSEPGEALEALRLLAERTEDAVEPEPARWQVWTEIARLLASLDAAEGADRAGEREAALREAVRGDFLVPEAYETALSLAEGVDPARKAWWAHVLAQLTGEEGGAPREPERKLDAEALDALHPGGIGWLERARQSLDTSEPPPIAELTRGLERIQPERWPVLGGMLSKLAAALGMNPPDTYVFRGEGAWGLSAWPTEPPIVLVGHDHLEEVGTHPLAMRRDAMAFALAVEVVHLAAKHPLLAFDGGLVGTSRSVYNAFGKYAGTAETVVDVVTLLPGVDQIAKIQTVIKLSRRVFTARSMVDKTTDLAGTSLGWLGFGSDGEDEANVGRRYVGPALQFRLQADRAALVLTGDLSAALEAILLGHPDTAPHWETVRDKGLLAALPALDEDTTMRVAGLFEFAAGE